MRVFSVARVHARHAAEDVQRLPRGQVAREPVPFRQIADAAAALGVRGGQPEKGRPSLRGVGQAEQNLDRGRLPGAVWPEQAEDFARLDAQVDAVEGGDVPGGEPRSVDLAQPLRLNRGLSHR